MYNGTYVADDLLLLCLSLSGLHRTLDQCTMSFSNLGFKSNTQKSMCIAISKASELKINAMQLQSQCLNWVKEYTYLGVKFRSGRMLCCETSPFIRKFYSSCNSVFSRAKHIDELAKLHLIETKCFPHLTYALPGLVLTSSQFRELNKAWNCAYRKAFNFHIWESVKLFIAGLSRLNFMDMKLKLTELFE